MFFTRGREFVEEKNKTVECGYPSLAAKHYWRYYHGWLAMTVYCLMPFVIMLTLNTAVIIKLRKMNERLSNRRSSTKSSEQMTASMTRMLLCVTFYFVLVTTPSFIFTYHQDQLFFTSKLSQETYADSELVDAILTLLLYLNHSINFVLYCLSGRRFRTELKLMLRELLRLDKADSKPSICDLDEKPELKRAAIGSDCNNTKVSVIHD